MKVVPVHLKTYPRKIDQVSESMNFQYLCIRQSLGYLL